MFLRVLNLSLLLVLLFQLPLHGPPAQSNPWMELERGLKACDVEIATYQSYCFISKNEQDRVVSAGEAFLEADLQARPGCFYSIQDSHEKEEILFQVGGADRAACDRLWNFLAETVGCCGETGDRVWSVEAYQDGCCDLTALGKKLAHALGGRLRQINTYPHMVQMLVYLPWAGEGILLDQGPANLNLELYEDSYLKKIRIRLGVPVLYSL